MLNEILKIIFSFLFGFLFGFIIRLFIRREESQIENSYKEIIKKMEKSNLLGFIPYKIEKSIIIQTEDNFSYWRRRLKEFYYKIRGKDIEIITIFEKEPLKQRIFIIKEAVKNAFLFSELLDTDLTDTLITYFSYKFSSEVLKSERKLIMELQKEFEKSSSRNLVIALENKDFSDRIVVNPPPEKKPILTEILLPMIIYKSKEIVEQNIGFVEKEKWKNLFSKFIKGIYQEKVGILYVGKFEKEWYYLLFKENFIKFSEGLIIASRGGYIEKHKEVENKIFENKDIKIRSYKIFGKWIFEKEREVNTYWLLIEFIS